MDAITKQKTLTGVLVTLLVGSVFAGVVIPTAEAGAFTAGATDATLDGGQPVSVTGNNVTYANTATVVAPTTGTVVYNTTYDMVFTNISMTSLVSGYAYSNTNTGLFLLRPDYTCQTSPCNTRPTSADGAHSGKVNVTFPGFTPDAAGLWTLRDGTNATVLKFFVFPQNSLTMTLSTASFAASQKQQVFTITVSPVNAGQSVIINATGILAPQTVAGTSGGTATYTFVGPLPQAGVFTIYATRDIYNSTNENASISAPGGGIAVETPRWAPEIQGTTVLTVTAAAINVLPVSVNSRSGFSTPATWNVTLSDTAAAVFSTATLAGANYNLTITGPEGTFWSNSSSLTPAVVFYNSAVGPVWANSSTGSYNFTANGPSLTWKYDANGNFTFVPNSTWSGGTYTFSLILNTGGGLASAPEYATTWTFTPSAPAAINLDLLWNGVTATNLSVLGSGCATPNPLAWPVCPDVQTSSTASAVGPTGYYTLTIYVNGTSQTIHPGYESLAVSNNGVSSNLSITGDVLILAGKGSIPAANYTGGNGQGLNTGIVTIPGIVPLKGSGSVTISLNWGGNVNTTTLPITSGSQLSASPTQLVVDTTSTITLTMKDYYGNLVPNGKIFLFNEPSGDASGCTFLCGATSVNGTGASGSGANGQYTLNLRPASVGKYIAYGISGSNLGGNDTRAYSYVEFSVVPGHDLAVSVTPNATWASLPTTFVVNATVPSTGLSLGTSVQIYLVNSTQWSDFLANGTLGTGVYPTSVVTGVGTPVDSNGGVLAYYFNASLLPDTYFVYVCGNSTGTGGLATNCGGAKHDNSQALPSIVVSPYVATFTPAQIANNAQVQANTTILVNISGPATAPNGTLSLNAGLSTGGLWCAALSGNCTPTTNTTISTFTVPISNGLGSFTATGLNIGTVAWKFQPNNQTTFSPLSSPVNGVLNVVGPNVFVNPTQIPIGKASTISVTVKSLTGAALSGIWIQVCGSPIGQASVPPAAPNACTGGALTDVNGQSLVGVNPISTGILTLYLNNVSTPTTVKVYAGLSISWTPPSPNQNDTVTITVAQVGQTAGESGVTVSVEKNGVVVSGFPTTASSNGQVVLPSVQQGTYNVTATKAGFQNATAQIVVGAPTVTPPAKAAKFQLSNLIAPSTGTVGQALSASADLQNTGDADGTANVLLLVNGAVRDSRSIPVSAGGKETVAFDFTPTTAGSFKVTVKLSTGETLAEKTVTVTTPPTSTPTTTTTTTTTTSTPPTTTTTTTTSTPPATTPTPKVPGFEVVALVGALAVAMLVLRRRS